MRRREIKITGLDRTIARLNRLKSEAIQRQALNKIAITATSSIKREDKRKQLKPVKNIFHRVGTRGIDFITRDLVNICLLKGTKPHLIEPTKRKTLSFSINGKKIFRKNAKHPGTKPQLFTLSRAGLLQIKETLMQFLRQR